MSGSTETIEAHYQEQLERLEELQLVTARERDDHFLRIAELEKQLAASREETAASEQARAVAEAECKWEIGFKDGVQDREADIIVLSDRVATLEVMLAEAMGLDSNGRPYTVEDVRRLVDEHDAPDNDAEYAETPDPCEECGSMFVRCHCDDIPGKDITNELLAYVTDVERRVQGMKWFRAVEVGHLTEGIRLLNDRRGELEGQYIELLRRHMKQGAALIEALDIASCGDEHHDDSHAARVCELFKLFVPHRPATVSSCG